MLRKGEFNLMKSFKVVCRKGWGAALACLDFALTAKTKPDWGNRLPGEIVEQPSKPQHADLSRALSAALSGHSGRPRSDLYPVLPATCLPLII